MIGAIIIVAVLALFPVAILMSGAGLAGILGWVLGTDAEDRDADGMYTELNR